MIDHVLVDTGPFLALIDRREMHHAWVGAQLADISPPLLTCEAILTKACYQTSTPKRQAAYQSGYDGTGYNTNVPY